jgi:cyclopropane-fatty-acyl-phospholipid synthase
MSLGAEDRVRRVHRRLARAGHDLPIRLWDRTTLGPQDAGYRLVLHRPGSLRGVLVPPTDLNVGEAFVADLVDVEGSMVAAIADLATLREGLRARDLAGLAWDVVRLPAPEPQTVVRERAHPDGRLHSPDRDRQAVRHHYDVGVDFYRLFLDEGLVYSCAYFLDGDEDHDAPPDPHGHALERAQARKLDVICRKLGLERDATLLDIGCGWGSLALHAATAHGARVLGVTLSEDQAVVAKQRVAEAGLEQRVEIRVQDYREVTGTFDAVSSIGMFEHVGSSQWTTYFRTAHARTRPGGRFLNHHITTGRRREVRDLAHARGSFVAQHVFPDGALPPADQSIGGLQDAGFELLDVEQLRPQYARTLRHWVARLEARHDRAADLVGEPTYRTWRAYMAGSAIGFDHGDLGLVQVLGGRWDPARPLGRAWMLPRD